MGLSVHLDFGMSAAAVTIYALSDPRKPAVIRYIGKTCKALSARLSGHVSYAQKKLTPKNSWIVSLKKIGLRPRIWPLEVCSEGDWQSRERHWISIFKPMGLLNLTSGGDAGPNMTGYIHTPESKAKISLSGTGRKIPRVATLKRVSKFRGFKHSAESISKMSAARKGKKLPPQAYARSAATNTGRKRTVSEVLKITAGIHSSPRFATWKQSVCKPVKCVTTGRVFESMCSAARFFGIRKDTLRNAIIRGTKCKKMEWRLLCQAR